MRKFFSCFMCGGNHYGKECPLKHQTVKEAKKSVQPSVGVLRVLSIVAVEVTESQEQDPMGLNFISTELNGHMVMAMVDSATTHNFMKDSVSKRLGLTLGFTDGEGPWQGQGRFSEAW